MSEAIANPNDSPSPVRPGIRWGVLAVCTAMQLAWFVGLFGAKSFWLDEILSIRFVQHSFGGMIDVLLQDVHPPGFYVFLWGWARAVPETEIALRGLPLVFSIGVLVPLWVLVRRLADERIALWACVLVSLSPFQAQFAAELRMYTMQEFFLLTATLLVLTLRERIGEPPRVWARVAILYVLNCLLLLYLHNFSAFWIVAHAVFLLLDGEAPRWRRWTVVYATVAIGFAPWVPVALRQASSNRLDWLSAVSGGNIGASSAISALMDFGLGESRLQTDAVSSLAFLFVLAPLVVAGVVACWRRREGRLLVLLTFLPFVELIALSQIRPLFMPRYLICSLPLYFALIAAGILSIRPCWIRWAAAGGVVVALSIGIYNARATRPHQDWLGIARMVREKIPPGDEARYAVLGINDRTRTTMAYYFDREDIGLAEVRVAILPGTPLAKLPGAPDRVALAMIGETFDSRSDMHPMFVGYRHDGLVTEFKGVNLDFFTRENAE